MTVHEPPRGPGAPRSAGLTSAQRALLAEFSRTAGRPALNRPFTVGGRPPRRTLTRNGICIGTAVTDAELLALARAGYLDYESQHGTVAFRDKAYERELQTAAMPEFHVGRDGIALAALKIPFGKHRPITLLRALLVLAAVALAVLYAAGVLSSEAAGTWGGIAGLLIAAVTLQLPQRARR